MAYVDTNPSGGASNVVFLHGNPTSSYLWRNIIPHVSAHARCLAPDLIGMGKSSKPHISYRFVDHQSYLEAFLDKILPVGKITFVIHDWGSALGFDWARRHEDRVVGVAFMEFITPYPTWDDFPQKSRKIFQAFRSGEAGRRLIIEQNAFVERVLPGSIVRKLSKEEMDNYRAPFLQPETREPTYRWPNELPIAGQPEEVVKTCQNYYDWLLKTEVPKLMLWADPGALITTEKAAWFATTLKNVKSVGIGPGSHFIQEDNPHLIGTEIVAWLATLLRAESKI